MKSIAFYACALFFALCASLLPARAQSTWSEYQSEDGGFSVELPDSANIQPELPLIVKMGDSLVLCKVWAVPFENPAEDNSLFLALYADLKDEYFKPDPAKAAHRIIDSLYGSFFSKPEATIIRTENHERTGYLNRDYKVLNNATRELINIRCFVIGRRFYAVEAVSRRQNDDAFRFVESFKLLK